ncbi:MAG TPA: RNA-binding protein [Tepidisphaeraceae bacterium]|nr:RNA-binding protein [Tepidisphaeraceae bacterium]
MGSKLYVGNLSYNATGSELEQLFAAHGNVQSAEVIADRDTGRSKGFGFVQMGSDSEAQAAIAALNGKEHDGRALTVNEAKPREDRPRSGGGGGYGNRGGGGGGGGKRRNF